MIVSLVMGFACGLPLLLTLSVLQAWMTEEGVDLSVIGLMTLVHLPYTIKFAWAPLLDRYTPPFLGRRRGWLLVIQIALMLAIACLGVSDPKQSPWLIAFAALLVTFFSASQDIVVDAYRREDLPDEELGLGSSMYVNGYRVGMVLASGGGLVMADHMSFQQVYLIMAACMLVGITTTLLTVEPHHDQGTPRTLTEAVYLPLLDFLKRNQAFLILAFIFCYKLGDSMASAMTTPFYLETGFTKTEIGAVVKLFGFWATIGGGFLGGLIILKTGIYRALWIFGGLQAVSTAGFALLLHTGPMINMLAVVIAFENLSSGMGTTAFVAYMASLTNKKFTATQYALLSSLIGAPRTFASAPTGFLVQAMGWGPFFIVCALIATPGMLLLVKVAPWRQKAA